jgi:hypothetical protein
MLFDHKDPGRNGECFYEDHKKQEYMLNDHYLIDLVEYLLLDLEKDFIR